MRRLALALGLCAGLMAGADAQPAAPPPVPVDIHLTVADQSDLLVVCVLAMRSTQITEASAIITLGEFCARLRSLMTEANRKVPPAPQPTKE